MINKKTYRNAFSNWASGVSVISTPADKPTGFTASSLISASLEPPLLSFYLGLSSSLFSSFKDCHRVGISILNADQEQISQHFAHPDQHDIAAHLEVKSGIPVIKDALVQMVGTVTETSTVGDHQLFIVALDEIYSTNTDKNPLIYYRQGYHQL